MCIEAWNIGARGKSCVKVEGYFKRNKAITDTTNDAACDLVMDYVSYEVKIQIGNLSLEASDTAKVRFSTTVDFNKLFTVSSTNAVGLVSSVAAVLAGVYALTF